MIIDDLFSKKQGIAEGGIATVGWPDEGNSTRNNTPVSVGGTFDARPVVKRGSLVKASGLTGVYRVMDILRDEAKIVQEIPRTGQSTYVPMSDLRVWTNKPIREQGMAEGQLELNTPDPVVVVQDQQGKILDKINLSVAAQKYKLGQPQNIKNQLAHQNYTKIGNYTIVSPMTGQPQDATTQGVAEGMAGKVVFSGQGADGGKYEIIQSSPTDFMIHANGRHIDTYGSLQRAMSVLKNEVPGLQQGMAEGSLEEVDRRGFLKGAGAAAVAGTGLAASGNAKADVEGTMMKLYGISVLYMACKEPYPRALAQGKTITIPPDVCQKTKQLIHRYITEVPGGKTMLQQAYENIYDDQTRRENEKPFKGSVLNNAYFSPQWQQKTLRDFESLLEFNESVKQGMAEVSLGNYRKKAAVSQAGAKIDRFFGRDDAAKVAAADQTIAKREKGLARADTRTRPYTPPAAAPADLEKQQRDLTAKYPNIDELVRRAELNRDPDYEMADGQAYYAARDAEQNYQKLRQIQRVIQGLNESLDRSHLP